MNHVAAFVLRLASIAARDHIDAYFGFLDAADDYDPPAELPPWLLWNAPGGRA